MKTTTILWIMIFALIVISIHSVNAAVCSDITTKALCDVNPACTANVTQYPVFGSCTLCCIDNFDANCYLDLELSRTVIDQECHLDAYCDGGYTNGGVNVMSCTSSAECEHFNNCINDCTQTTCDVSGQLICINNQTDNQHCGACNNACDVGAGEGCVEGICKVLGVTCGDGSVNQVSEQCDDGNNIDTDVCNHNCQNTTCGDQLIQWPNGVGLSGLIVNGNAGYEQCDNNNIGDAACGPDTGNWTGSVSCDFCLLIYNCRSQCGNGHCEEGESSCLADCGLDGWHTNNTEWTLEDRTLRGNASNIFIVSDYFDLKVNKNYTISGSILNPTTCAATIDLDDGTCLSADNWSMTSCFTDPLPSYMSVSGGRDWKYISHTFTIPYSKFNTSDGLYKKVHIRLSIICSGSNTVTEPIYFDDISLKEVSDMDIFYNNQPAINATSSCCPEDRCWTGSECVLPTEWSESDYPNLWSALDINSYSNEHVNISMQYLAKGYRCVLNDSGYADWQPAQIKYDWDFKESGYCMRESDCFVSNTFSGIDNPDMSFLLGENNINNGGSSCIKNRQFIDDNYNINAGNHYCMNGNWTTKTFLIANVLENISESKDHIIFCDDAKNIFNSNNYPSSIGGGCTLILKEGDNERIITGFYVTNDSSVICDLYDIYAGNRYTSYDPFDSGCSDVPNIKLGIESCDSYGDDFKRCAYISGPNNNGFYVYLKYIDNKTVYYLVSNEPISEIESNFITRTLDSIVQFFQKLFGYTPKQPLGLAAQTTNYERTYVLNNHTLKVYGIEEQKYDENLEEVMSFMYLNMTGQGIYGKNPINIEYINKTINGEYYYFNETPDSQLLIIKYKDSTNGDSTTLWPYLTAMLRDRP